MQLLQAVEPVHALEVDLLAALAQQSMQAPIAEAPTLSGQLAQQRPQPVVTGLARPGAH